MESIHTLLFVLVCLIANSPLAASAHPVFVSSSGVPKQAARVALLTSTDRTVETWQIRIQQTVDKGILLVPVSDRHDASSVSITQPHPLHIIDWISSPTLVDGEKWSEPTAIPPQQQVHKTYRPKDHTECLTADGAVEWANEKDLKADLSKLKKLTGYCYLIYSVDSRDFRTHQGRFYLPTIQIAQKKPSLKINIAAAVMLHSADELTIYAVDAAGNRFEIDGRKTVFSETMVTVGGAREFEDRLRQNVRKLSSPNVSIVQYAYGGSPIHPWADDPNLPSPRLLWALGASEMGKIHASVFFRDRQRRTKDFKASKAFSKDVEASKALSHRLSGCIGGINSSVILRVGASGVPTIVKVTQGALSGCERRVILGQKFSEKYIGQPVAVRLEADVSEFYSRSWATLTLTRILVTDLAEAEIQLVPASPIETKKEAVAGPTMLQNQFSVRYYTGKERKFSDKELSRSTW